MNGSKYRGAIFISISFAQCAALSSPLVILGVLDRSRYGAVLILISLVQPSRHFLRAVSLYIIVARCTCAHLDIARESSFCAPWIAFFLYFAMLNPCMKTLKISCWHLCYALRMLL